MWPMLIAAGASILGGMLQKGQKNPADSAMPYMNQVGGVLQGAFNPYIQAGQQQLPGLESAYANMQNPNFINNMGQSFQQSPGYNFEVNQALGAANRAAAAGGMLGTPQEQQNVGGAISGIANQDYYNWLNHAMNAYQMGVQGDQGLYNTGFQASSQYGSDMAQALMNQAQLAYSGAVNQNQSQGGGIGAMLGGIGSLGGLFGGGNSGGGGGGNAGTAL